MSCIGCSVTLPDLVDLPCGHSICRRCVRGQRLDGGIACPLDGSVHNMSRQNFLSSLATAGQQEPLPMQQEPLPEQPEPLPKQPEPLFEHQEPLSEHQEPLSEHRELLSEHQESLLEHQVPLSEHQVPLSEHQEPLSEHQEPLSEHREPLSEQLMLRQHLLTVPDELGLATLEIQPLPPDNLPVPDDPNNIGYLTAKLIIDQVNTSADTMIAIIERNRKKLHDEIERQGAEHEAYHRRKHEECLDEMREGMRKNSNELIHLRRVKKRVKKILEEQKNEREAADGENSQETAEETENELQMGPQSKGPVVLQYSYFYDDFFQEQYISEIDDIAEWKTIARSFLAMSKLHNIDEINVVFRVGEETSKAALQNEKILWRGKEIGVFEAVSCWVQKRLFDQVPRNFVWAKFWSSEETFSSEKSHPDIIVTDLTESFYRDTTLRTI